MNKRALLLVGIVLVGVTLRLLPWGNVSQPSGSVWFLGPDSWYHVRLAEYSAGHLLHPLTNDPLVGTVGYMPLLPVAVAAISRALDVLPGVSVAGVIEYVGAGLPVLVAGLTIVAVYLLSLRLFKRPPAALVAALLVAIMPGQYLARTLFGYADHHALEVLLTVTALLGLASLRTRWGGGYLAAVSIGLLILAWQGALLFIGVVAGSVVLRDLWWYLKGTPHWFAYSRLSGTRVFVVLIGAGTAAYGLLQLWGYEGVSAQALALLGMTCAVALVAILPHWKWRALRVATVMGCLLAGVYGVSVMPWGEKTLAVHIATLFRNVFVSMDGVVEAQGSTLRVLWATYGLVLPLALVGVYLTRWRKGLGVFLCWSAVVLAMAIGQQRWHYYLLIPVSILAGYAAVLLFEAVITRARPVVAGVEVALLLLVSVPLPYTAATVFILPGMTPALHEALTFLKTETPDSPEYSVLSWWDYGTYILRVSGRRPVASSVNQFHMELDWFRSQTEAEATQVLAGTDVRYILLTEDTVDRLWERVSRGFPPVTRTEPVIDRPVAIAVRLWEGEAITGYARVFSNTAVQIYSYSTAEE